MNDNKENTKIYFYISIAASVTGFVMFGLSFSPLGLYALISSILLGIAALSFAIRQKKKNNFNAVIYAKTAAYVLLALSVLLFLGGLVYSIIKT